jgi:D-ribose pyranase
LRRNQGTLNGPLSRVISELGHTDTLVVSDAGLPIPRDVERVDLAVRKNLPRFLDVLDTVLAELQVERVLLAEEIKAHSPAMLKAIEQRFDKIGIPLGFVPHIEFKQATTTAKAAVRTGEFTPYSNVLLTAGVVY